jgi:hypothetical protein
MRLRARLNIEVPVLRSFALKERVPYDLLADKRKWDDVLQIM